jgi:hypothetical protein
MTLGKTFDYEKLQRVLEILVPALLVSLLVVSFTFEIRDGDLFWHIKSGEYIATHKMLPQFDAFSFTVSDAAADKVRQLSIPVVLKGYWLGQIVLYGIWKQFGPAGIVVLRALVYGVMVTLAYVWTRRASNIVLAAGFTLLLGSTLAGVGNERPQLFSFAIALVVLFLLEKIMREERLRPYAALLPLLLLLWGNTHRAYLMGSGIIVLYMVGYAIDCRVTGARMDRGKLALLAVSALIVLANPTGIKGTFLFVRNINADSNMVNEYLTPFHVARKFHIYMPSYWIAVFINGVAATVCVMRKRFMPAVVVGGIVVLSLQAVRHVPYALIVLPVIAPCLASIPRRVLAVPLAAGVLFWLNSLSFASLCRFRVADTFPEYATMAINDVRPEGRMFNYYDWGGYLMLNAPEYQVFVDGRVLDERLLSLHNSVLLGQDWKNVFSRYGIHFAVIPWRDSNTNLIIPLAYRLLAEDDWDVLYFGANDALFLQRTPVNRGIIDTYGSRKAELRALVGKMVPNHHF